LEEAIPSHWSPELGIVQVTINPDNPWSALIATDTNYPGMYNYFVGGSSLKSKKLS